MVGWEREGRCGGGGGGGGVRGAGGGGAVAWWGEFHWRELLEARYTTSAAHREAWEACPNAGKAAGGHRLQGQWWRPTESVRRPSTKRLFDPRSEPVWASDVELRWHCIEKWWPNSLVPLRPSKRSTPRRCTCWETLHSHACDPESPKFAMSRPCWGASRKPEPTTWARRGPSQTFRARRTARDRHNRTHCTLEKVGGPPVSKKPPPIPPAGLQEGWKNRVAAHGSKSFV